MNTYFLYTHSDLWDLAHQLLWKSCGNVYSMRSYPGQNGSYLSWMSCSMSKT